MWRSAALLVAVPLLASGCSAAGASDHATERALVSDFFDLLESGETGNIAALLTEDSALTSAVLDSDFYASSVERPSGAKVVAAAVVDPGLVYVSVEYSIAGEDRDIKVGVVESDGEPKIDGWLHETLSVDPLRAPGAWRVNGSVDTGELEKSTQFVALPGVYTFEYVDPQGLGTVDPEGAPSEPFDVEFPIESDRLGASVPSGVTATGSAIGAEPLLLGDVDDAVEAQLSALRDSCSASGLVGETCPLDLVAQVGALGIVDSATVVWTDASQRHVVPTADWDVVAQYAVAFTYVDAAGRTNRTGLDATLRAVVTSDSLGKPVLELAG